MFLETKNKMTFVDFVNYCISKKELLVEFDRLNSTNLSMSGTGLDIMIDKSTGRLEHDVALFVDFCKLLWERIPKD